MERKSVTVPAAVAGSIPAGSNRPRPRELGIEIGVFSTGRHNAITDVAGVLVGQIDVHDAARGAHTGVTAILPHNGNIFQNKVPAGIFLGNGFGKLTGYPQVRELGNIETPVILTNTLNVAAGLDGILDYTFSFPDNKDVRSVNCIVGETNDGLINDIRARFVTREHVLAAIMTARPGPVTEGSVGAGSGTCAFGMKGGIGTASRILPESMGGYTVGVLVQSNFGGFLTIRGVEVGREFGTTPCMDGAGSADGSIMMVVATDAPLDSRNLERLAKRAFMGMSRTGGVASNGSGDFVIAFSTARELLVAHQARPLSLGCGATVRNNDMTPIFMATIESTEEAIINSLFAAEAVTGFDGRTIPSLPVDRVLRILERHGAISKQPKENDI